MARTTSQLLDRDGQSRRQRWAEALDPGYAKIDDRSMKELLEFAAGYARQVNYFGGDNRLAGDWQPFFPAGYGERLEDAEMEGRQPPHLALYLAFLKLFQLAQEHLNGLTQRHLDFYYGEVLGLRPHPARPDRAHLLLKPKKGVNRQAVPAGTLFKAGKDSNGKELFYSLTEDLIVNQGQLAELRSLYQDPQRGSLHVAPVANSADGLGAPLDPAQPRWRPFGHGGLPQPQLGFALASPVLALSQGSRRIKVSLSLTAPAPPELSARPVSLFFSGEQGWIGPLSATLKAVESNKLELEAVLSGEEPPLAGYRSELHGGGFETAFPLIKVVLAETAGYRSLQNVFLSGASVQAAVEGLVQLDLENDLGAIKPEKPFMPFGPQPEPGAKLYVGCPEALARARAGLLDSYHLTAQWLAPARLAKLYRNYRTEVNSNSHFQADLIAWDGTSQPVALFGADASAAVELPAKQPPGGKAGGGAGAAIGLGLKGDKLARQQSSGWARREVEKIKLLERGGFGRGRGPGGKPRPPAQLQRGLLELRLRTSFLHREYRELYVKNITEFVKKQDCDDCTLTLPREPYTPLLERLTLSYRATATADYSQASAAQLLTAEVELFQLGAFGVKREDAFLKEQAGPAVDRRVRLLPAYPYEGEFYLGLTGLEPGLSLSLLAQVAEGSADPELEKAELAWSLLVDNEWRPLKPGQLRDGSNGLLKSGLIQVALPADASEKNTLLPAGRFWLRVTAAAGTAAVCSLIDLQVNAAAVQFVDRGNEPSHLATVLPAGAIAKAAQPLPGIKSIAQPYASFGGAPAEDDRSFYLRASERLRHKDRAVALWDYERLVLERFPFVYKVKCLNHTAPGGFAAPGHVTLVVLPDLRDLNAVDPLRPRLSKGALEEIKSFLAAQAGAFVELHLENPVYEELQVAAKVAFSGCLDFDFCCTKLEKEIKQLLSPWAFADGQDISFQGGFRQAAILDFIEERDYVDYVTDFSLRQMIPGRQPLERQQALPSTPRAILVSSREHVIDPV